MHVRGPSALGALLEAGGELADELPTRISRPAVSRHLRLLKRAGLVADRAEGTRRVYRIDDEGIAAVREYLEHVWGRAAARFRLLARTPARGQDGCPLTEPVEPIETEAAGS